MTSRMHLVIVIVASTLSMSLPVWGQQYLYEPRPVPAEQTVSPQEGILVREVEVKKGDTMFDLSRTYSGHGMYYPQILLFNSIKNPNLIYPGNVLKIPVMNKSRHVSGRVPRLTPEAPRAGSVSGNATVQTETAKKAPVLQSIAPTSTDTAPAAAASEVQNPPPDRKRAGGQKKPATTSKLEAPVSSGSETAKSQQLFEKAVKAYRQDDCRTALELLDRYLIENAASPLAADANLYKAECYLKLSVQ